MKPQIICHIVGSAEGRLQVKKLNPPINGSPKSAVRELNEFISEKLGAQGWIVSCKSMKRLVRGKKKSLPETLGNLHQTFIGHRRGSKIALAVDPTGKLHYGKSHTGKDHFVAMLGTQVSAEYLCELRDEGVSYLFAGEDGTDYHQAMETLYQDFAVERLLLEGGDMMNGQFLQADLIDELSLLFYPGIKDLSSPTSLFDIPQDIREQLAHHRVLRLISCEALDNNFVWIRYAIEKE